MRYSAICEPFRHSNKTQISVIAAPSRAMTSIQLLNALSDARLFHHTGMPISRFHIGLVFRELKSNFTNNTDELKDNQALFALNAVIRFTRRHTSALKAERQMVLFKVIGFVLKPCNDIQFKECFAWV
jgi:hypothetical protein